MKFKWMASAGLAAIVLGTPALAGAPTGKNSSTLTQSGDAGKATVNQNGTLDSSTVTATSR